MKKKDILKEEIRHIDIKKINSIKIIESMKDMSFSARDLARASEIFDKMLADEKCSIILSLAGSTSAAGCMQVYSDMVKYNMVDVVVATGASIVDMDFFEALGFKHYKGKSDVNDKKLRDDRIDRIYDTFIDEDDVEECTKAITEIANNLEPKVFSSREFIYEMGKFLVNNPKKSKKRDSLIQLAYENDVPIFCPAFSDSTAGYGLVKHQVDNPKKHIAIDSIKDFKELAEIKWRVKDTGIFVVGGGVPKNFIQDVVVCTELTGKAMPMHKYAIQISVADVRDGGLSGSTFKEAQSWGKVQPNSVQMVFGEATLSVPLIVSYAFHKKNWKTRKAKRLTTIF